MSTVCQNYCLVAIELSEKLLKLADDANSDCDHDACLVLFGIILDSASKIRTESEKRLKQLTENNLTPAIRGP